MALLVPLAAAARTRVVAADPGAACRVCLGLREQRAHVVARRIRRDDPPRDGDRRRPLAGIQAVVEQLRRTACERAISSESSGTRPASSAGGITCQKLNRPWKPKGLPIG